MAVLRAAVSAALLLVACGTPEPAGDPGVGAGIGPGVGKAPPSRVIATAPAIVETLYALDVEDRVVGVGDYAAWPPEVEEKPRIGGLFDPRLETIAALEPDLAILLVSEKALSEPLERLGVEVMLLDVETVEDVARAIEEIGERMGESARAAELSAEFWRGLDPNPLQGASGDRPRVLLSIVREAGRLAGVLTANRETFYQELLERVGAENVFAEASIRYPQVAVEEIVAREPSVILELQPRTQAAELGERLVADWRNVPFLDPPCVRVVSGAHTVLPGPRLPELFRDLRAAVAECLGVEAPA